MRRAVCGAVVLVLCSLVAACAQPLRTERQEADGSLALPVSAHAQAALIGLPLSRLDACAAKPASSVDEPKFSERRYVTALSAREPTGATCVLHVEARDGVVDRLGVELRSGGGAANAPAACFVPIVACIGPVRTSSGARPLVVRADPLASSMEPTAQPRRIRVVDLATPMARTEPSLVPPAPGPLEPQRVRPQPECIRLAATPAGHGEPGIAQHLAFRNVCAVRISLWHCDQRGCPRMTAHAFVEPGDTSTYATRKDANPAPGGGDFVACPSPKADYVRREDAWVCTSAP